MAKLIVGENDLATVNPKLAKEWHTEYNDDLTPLMVTAGSNKKVWWKCEKGHVWKASVYDRNHGTGCPQCKPQRVRRLVQGENDLLTVNPAVALEWHPTKNGELKPDQVTANSNEKVWWQCSKGHEWQAMIFNRVKGVGSCPICAEQNKVENIPKLAVTHPALAAQWHPTKNGDLRPETVASNYKGSVWWQCENGHEWQAEVIRRRTDGSGCPHCARNNRIARLNSKDRTGRQTLLTFNPDIAAQWHPTKNGELTPAQVSPRSASKVWWQCEKGHEWAVTISFRTRGAGCPICAREKKLESSPKRLSLYPALAKAWHPTKNGSFTPDQVTIDTVKEVWWQCEKGHEWQKPVKNYVLDSSCPYCSNAKVLKGFNDLATNYPTLAKELHPTKNGFLLADAVLATSKKLVWWKCEKGHVWKAKICDRVNDADCPICKRKVAAASPNYTLAEHNPALAMQWHPTKNGDLTPQTVKPRSSRKVWWQCEKGHEWQATVVNRAKGAGCPVCYKKKTKLDDHSSTGEEHVSRIKEKDEA